MNDKTLVLNEKVDEIELARQHKLAYLFIKRTFDIFVGLIGTILLLPLALIIKIAYMLSGDFSSIIYKQARIGMNGKTIHIYKFRSMIPNADEELKKILRIKKYKEEWKQNQKIENDPRITKIGKLLRKASLDEVPQFINVLVGDMSLVGPRPLVKGELDAHNGNHAIYESVRPGITGWWACNGRSALDYEKRLELEYFYVENACISLDIKCMIKTVTAVVSKDGAK